MLREGRVKLSKKSEAKRANNQKPDTIFNMSFYHSVCYYYAVDEQTTVRQPHSSAGATSSEVDFDRILVNGKRKLRGTAITKSVQH